MNKTKWTRETVLREIRRIGSDPSKSLRVKEEVPQYLNRVAARFFGSWKKAIAAAMGPEEIAQRRRGLRMARKREELQKVLSAFVGEHGFFPSDKDFGNNWTAHVVREHWGSFDNAFEEILGASPRLTILRAVRALTVGACPVATTVEIYYRLKHDLRDTTSLKRIGIMLGRISEKGFLSAGYAGATRVWSVTEKGRTLIRTYPDCGRVAF